MSTDLDNLLALAQADGRLCPQPQWWNELWQLLQKQGGEGPGPLASLILAAWWDTSDAEKCARFLYRIRWAAEHGSQPAVAEFIESLGSNQWHYERE